VRVEELEVLRLGFRVDRYARAVCQPCHKRPQLGRAVIEIPNPKLLPKLVAYDRSDRACDDPNTLRPREPVPAGVGDARIPYVGGSRGKAQHYAGDRRAPPKRMPVGRFTVFPEPSALGCRRVQRSAAIARIQLPRPDEHPDAAPPPFTSRPLDQFRKLRPLKDFVNPIYELMGEVQMIDPVGPRRLQDLPNVLPVACMDEPAAKGQTRPRLRWMRSVHERRQEGKHEHARHPTVPLSDRVPGSREVRHLPPWCRGQRTHAVVLFHQGWEERYHIVRERS